MQRIKIPFELIKLPNNNSIQAIDNEIDLLALEDEENYHIIIKAQINKLAVNLILDTGASKTVLDEDKYKSILKPIPTNKPILSSGISENIDVQFVWLENLTINGFGIKTFVSGLTKLNHINEIYKMYGLPYIDGLIGNDILIKYQAVINYKFNELIFETNI